MPDAEGYIVRPGPGRRIGFFLLLMGVLGAGYLYLNPGNKPQAIPEWKPGPYDPPVQYAFIPDDSDCPGPLTAEEEDAPPKVVRCSEWRLRVHYKTGEGKQEIGITYGAGCGGYGADFSEDDCTSDIPLFDAASQAQVEESFSRGVPLRVSPDGHHIAYFSKTRMQFVGWDLPAAQLKPISPRLDGKALDRVRSLEISPDGRFFAVAFSGTQPQVLLTELATGQTSTFPGFCRVLGISESATAIAVKRTCPELEEDNSASNTVTMLNRQGIVTSEWVGGYFSGVLSPDGRLLVEALPDINEDNKDYLVTYDTKTGKTSKKLELRLLSEPSYASGYDWINAQEYIVQANAPEGGGSFGYYAVNVQTGKSQRIRDLGLDPGNIISLGKVRIKN
ncbi:hypothetical protein [Acrocarpospora sp. B8E8]|uniref:hypothetical protein n=1 Tax=Acrocarpospora sp. B8E8 TaxID=3153572 RepID=UPI00325E5F0A